MVVASGQTRAALDTFIAPAHRFLIEHVEASAILLHHFDRFAAWTRWFGYGVMRQVLDAEAASSAKSRGWEKSLRKAATEWVFRDGMEIEGITTEPDAAHGNLDYLLLLPGGRQAVVEAKILGKYGDTPYGLSSLKKGINQLLSYGLDRGVAEFLLVFHNFSEELTVDTSGAVTKVPGTSNSYMLRPPHQPDRRIGIIIARVSEPPKPSDGLKPQVIRDTHLLSIGP